MLEFGKIDIRALKSRVNELDETQWDREEDFAMNYNKHAKSALRQTQHIIFRFSNKQVFPYVYQNCSPWEGWKSLLLPILKKATAPYGYTNGFFSRIMLAKLPAQEFIAPHIDGDERGYAPHKIHIPVQTNDSAYFFLDNQRFHLKEGYAYEVNNGTRHAVANQGNSHRIHLIFEYLNVDEQDEVLKAQIELCKGQDE